MGSNFQVVSRSRHTKRDDDFLDPRKVDNAWKAHLSVNGEHPVCGSGKDRKAWQLCIGGLDAVTCVPCLKKGIKLLQAVKRMKCKRCGCTEKKACIGDDGRPCCWVAKSLCSDCETPKERRLRRGNGKH